MTRSTIVVATCLLASVGFLTTGSRPASARQWSPHMGPPPPLVGYIEDTTTTVLRYATGDILGRVSLSADRKEVSILWSHVPSGAALRQVFPVAYWPTAASANSSRNRLAVGGKRRNGNTVVERWSINKPLVTYPHGSSSAPALEPAVVTEIETLYDAAVQGRDMVHRVLLTVNDPNAWLVQFYDSKDVYRIIDAAPVALNLVASISSQPGVLEVPGLGDIFTGTWAADHVNRGYVYTFVSGQGGVSTLVLIDANRDGIIESWTRPSDQEWVEGDWADAANYTYP